MVSFRMCGPHRATWAKGKVVLSRLPAQSWQKVIACKVGIGIQMCIDLEGDARPWQVSGCYVPEDQGRGCCLELLSDGQKTKPAFHWCAKYGSNVRSSSFRRTTTNHCIIHVHTRTSLWPYEQHVPWLNRDTSLLVVATR